jgi:hypothetical protein
MKLEFLLGGECVYRPGPAKDSHRRPRIVHPIHYMEENRSIFDEQYRVVAIEGDHLVIRGILSGEVLTIVNPEPGTPLTEEEYPPGKLIALTDPSAAPLN